MGWTSGAVSSYTLRAVSIRRAELALILPIMRGHALIAL